jgi:hypothetical protein
VTQIISVITQKYVLLVSDRRLTSLEDGKVFYDEECKLVSLCNICGIGYSGLAKLDGISTHEWIARTLAAANCHNASRASQILAQMTPRALSKVKAEWRRQIFLLAGWSHFDNPPALRSYYCVVTNTLDENGQMLATPRERFDRTICALRDDEQFLYYTIGQPIKRVGKLERNLRRLVEREIGPKETLRLLVDGVINTHAHTEKVGDKILGFCIPKHSVEIQLQTGYSTALAKFPDEHSVAFVYFDPAYSELRQYGPTVVCGEFAATDIETENDPTRNFQSSKMRLLGSPKRKT